MNRRIDLLIPSTILAALVTIPACTLDNSSIPESTEDTHTSFEDFEAQTYREPDTGIYIVNGDTPIRNIQDLENFYRVHLLAGH